MALQRSILALAVVISAAICLPPGPARAQARGGEWRAYAADKTNSRYSPLDQINRDTASRLRIAWRQSVIPAELRERWPAAPVPNVSQNTPLMVDGLLYVSTAVGVATALDPATGKVVWFDVPPDRPADTAATGRVAAWRPGERAVASRIGPTAATRESSRSQVNTSSRSTRGLVNGIRSSGEQVPGTSISRKVTTGPRRATAGAVRRSSSAT